MTRPYRARSADIAGKAPCLPEGVLARRRVRAIGRCRVRDAGAVAGRPDAVPTLHAECRLDDDASALVERQPKLGEEWVRFDTRRPDDVSVSIRDPSERVAARASTASSVVP
jgi:hypothetical protein